MYKILIALLATVSLLTAGCATLLSGKNTAISMKSSVSAEVWIDGVQHGQTPLTLNLDSSKSHVIQFKKAGYKTKIFNVEPNIGVGWVIADVFLGLVPVIIDAATGSWNYLSPDDINWPMEKVEPVSK